MSAGKTIKLNSGYECPRVGYGSWQSNDVAKLTVALNAALDAGYRHIDTADVYGNEHVIGNVIHEAIEAGKVKREDIFLVTKIYIQDFRPDRVVPKLKSQLALLKTSYVDLYLIHFPVAAQPSEPGSPLPFKMENGKVVLDLETKLEDTWHAMEQCVELGLSRSIGVSNFNIKQVERLLKMKTPPAMNQFESHPFFQNTKLIEFCQKHGVAVTGYSCFGAPGTVVPFSGEPYISVDILGDERIKAIASKHGKSTAQVILRWQFQRNVIVIPKSVTPSRVADNINIWDFELASDDMKAMAAIDENKRFCHFPNIGLKDHPEYPFFEEASC